MMLVKVHKMDMITRKDLVKSGTTKYKVQSTKHKQLRDPEGSRPLTSILRGPGQGRCKATSCLHRKVAAQVQVGNGIPWMFVVNGKLMGARDSDQPT